MPDIHSRVCLGVQRDKVQRGGGDLWPSAAVALALEEAGADVARPQPQLHHALAGVALGPHTPAGAGEELLEAPPDCRPATQALDLVDVNDGPTQLQRRAAVHGLLGEPAVAFAHAPVSVLHEGAHACPPQAAGLALGAPAVKGRHGGESLSSECQS